MKQTLFYRYLSYACCFLLTISAIETQAQCAPNQSKICYYSDFNNSGSNTDPLYTTVGGTVSKWFQCVNSGTSLCPTPSNSTWVNSYTYWACNATCTVQNHHLTIKRYKINGGAWNTWYSWDANIQISSNPNFTIPPKQAGYMHIDMTFLTVGTFTVDYDMVHSNGTVLTQLPNGGLSSTVYVSCPTASGMTYNNTTSTGTTLDWNTNGAATNGYAVRYRTTGGWTYNYPSSSYLNLSNLVCNTTYEWQVAVYCSSGTGSYSSSQYVTTSSCAPTCTDSYESNNSSGAAYNLGSTTSWNGNMCLTASDNDWFRFTYGGNTYYINAKGYNTSVTGAYNLSLSISGGVATIQTNPVNGSTTDTYLELYDSSLNLLTNDDDAGVGNFSLMNYTFPVTCNDPFEANNTSSQAYSIGSSTSFSNNNPCLTAGDADYWKFLYNGNWYYFQVVGYNSSTVGNYGINFNLSGGVVTIATYSVGGSNTDTKLYLFDASMNQLAWNDDYNSTLFSQVSYTLCNTVVANFTGTNSTIVNTNITLSNTSTNYTNLNWSATGGTPASASTSTFNTSFAVAGWHTITLTASSNCGTNTISQQIWVAPNQFAPLPADFASRINPPIIKKVGDPFNPIFGWYEWQQKAMETQGVTALIWEHYFYGADANISRTMGYGWSNSYDISIETLTNLWTVRYGDGHKQSFVPYQNGTSVPIFSAIQDSLVQNTNGTFILFARSGKKMYFNTTGKITQWVDLHNNSVFFQYDSSGKLIGISATGGRSFTLSYNAAGLLYRVTNVLGHYVEYNYVNGNLTQIRDVNGGITQFNYNASHQITDVYDPKTKHMTQNLYNATGNIISQKDVFLKSTNVAYFPNYTQITDALGGVEKFYFNGSFENTQYTNPINGNVYLNWSTTHHQVNALQNERGFSTNFGRNAKGDLQSITDALSFSTNMVRNAQGDVISMSNSLQAFTLAYNTLRDPITMVLPNMGTISTVFNHFGQDSIVTDSRGFKSYFYHNAQGDLTSIVTPTGAYSIGLDVLGRIISITDGNSNSTLIQYSNSGNITLITDPMLYTLQMTYDANGNLLSFKDKANHWTYYEYDDKDRLVKVTVPNTKFMTFSYDDLDRLVSTTDLNGLVTKTFFYDAKGRVVSVNDALGSTSYTYDAADNVLTINRSGRSISYIYDALNRPISITEPSPLGGTITTTMTYDGLSRTKTVSKNGKIMEFYYDSMGALVKVKDFNGEYFEFIRDLNGNVTTYKDANNHNKTFTFDGSNRLISMTDGGGSYTYTWDAADNLTSTTDAKNITLSITRNNNYLPTQMNFSTGEQFSYGYNPNEEIISGSSLNGGTTTITRDIMGLPIAITDPFSNVVSFKRDNMGNVLKMFYPGGDSVSYTYNNAYLPTSVKDWLGRETIFQWNTFGQPTNISYANGTTTQFGYDLAGNLTNKTHKYANSTIFSSNILSIDAEGKVSQDAGIMSLLPNISQQTKNYTHRTDDALSSNGYAADNNGNVNTLPDNSNLPTNYSVSFNGLDQVTSVIKGAKQIQMAYNAFGSLQQKTENGVVRRYVYDDVTSVMPLLLQEKNASNQTKVQYIWGPLGVIARDSAGMVQYYHTDYQDNVIALTGSNGQITDNYAYAPFGDFITHTGSTHQPFTFAGGMGVMQVVDNIYYARARWFDSNSGRFLTKDPLAGEVVNPQSFHKYALGLNNPQSFGDPTGLKPEGLENGIDTYLNFVGQAFENFKDHFHPSEETWRAYNGKIYSAIKGSEYWGRESIGKLKTVVGESKLAGKIGNVFKVLDIAKISYSGIETMRTCSNQNAVSCSASVISTGKKGVNLAIGIAVGGLAGIGLAAVGVASAPAIIAGAAISAVGMYAVEKLEEALPAKWKQNIKNVVAKATPKIQQASQWVDTHTPQAIKTPYIKVTTAIANTYHSVTAKISSFLGW